MRTLFELLKMLAVAYPPPPGTTHSVTVDGEKLKLHVVDNNGDTHVLGFEESDFDRLSLELFEDVSQLLRVYGFNVSRRPRAKDITKH